MKGSIKKKTEVISSAAHRGVEIGKKFSSDIQAKAKNISEKNKLESYKRKIRKYNPLFPQEYNSEEFNIPNMIVIVDDAIRKGIDVCEGAIGWLSNENGMEVLHLYDEFINESGIEFVPAAICDAVYYVDRFDRKKFIQTDCIFSKAHEERLAELKNIAYSLGAKRCSIEISESNSEIKTHKAKSESKSKANLNSLNISVGGKKEQKSSYKDVAKRSGNIEVEFGLNNEVKMPQLKWFAHDDTIKNLVKMRLEDRNSIKSEILYLEGSVSATMSRKTAYAIDSAISKIGSSNKSDMENQATRENHSRLIFSIDF